MALARMARPSSCTIWNDGSRGRAHFSVALTSARSQSAGKVNSIMCGIVACARSGEAIDFLLSGLGRLEYRGYDSAGVALADSSSGALHLRRVVGRVDALRRRVAGEGLPAGSCRGIGHTRWATHGAVTEANAHPHHDCGANVAVVHNGIVENAEELRAKLEALGHRFASDVDTEVIPHLIEEARTHGNDLAAAVRVAVSQLEGSWALAVLAGGSDQLVVAANRSPLVIAKADDGWYVASDVAAVLERSREVRALADGDVVAIDRVARWTDAAGREVPPRPVLRADWRISDVELGTFRDAAAITRRVLGSVGRFPTELVVASEHDGVLEPGTLTVAFSQSGETADVLAAVRRYGGPVLAVTNTPHSSLARMADATIDCMAGPEVGVAASKTFTTQVLAGSVFAIAAARAAGRAGDADAESLLETLAAVPGGLQRAHELSRPVAEVVADLVTPAPGFLFVSRGAGLPYAAEGALKLKELTYRWAEAYPAGELKHGPIALIDPGTPVFLIEGGHAAKLESNVAEMRARGAKVLRVGSSEEATFPVVGAAGSPWGPLESVVALQHVARALAIRLGRDVDKPRNL